MQDNHTMRNTHTSEYILNIRLEEIGWALFLILIGALWLIPPEIIPSHAWLIGAGIIMLGVNFARFIAGIKMSGFTVFLGIVALVAGLAGNLAVDVPVFATVLIVLGFSLLMRALFKRRKS